MYGTITVKDTAGHPNLPLPTVYVDEGSAATISISDVPASATSVTLTMTNADGTALSTAAEYAGGIWTATIPASHFASVGSIAGGTVVKASDGTSEWTLGVGNLVVLSASATPSPGETTTNITDKTLEGETLDTSTLSGLKAALKTVAETMGATVSALAICCSAFGGEVYTAPLADLPIDTAQVVTGVTFGAEGGITTNDVCGIVTNEVSTFSSWTIYRDGVDITTQVEQPFYDPTGEMYGFVAWIIGGSIVADDDPTGFGAHETEGSGLNATGLEWETDSWEGELYTVHAYTATRTVTSIQNALGLARLSDLPPLTNGIPEAIAAATPGDYAAVSNRAMNAVVVEDQRVDIEATVSITGACTVDGTTTFMDYVLLTSWQDLVLSDYTTLPSYLTSRESNFALKSDAFYSFTEPTLAESSGVYTYAAGSNEVAYVELGAGTNVLAITVPPAFGKARDFALTVSTPYTNATIQLDTSVDWHFDADSTNISAGAWTRLYFTECPAGVFSLQKWEPDSSQAAQ